MPASHNTVSLKGNQLAALLGVSPASVSRATKHEHFCQGYEIARWAVHSSSGRVIRYDVPKSALANFPNATPAPAPSTTRSPSTMTPDQPIPPEPITEKGAARSKTIWGALLILVAWAAAQAGLQLDLGFAKGFMDDGALSALEIIQLVGVLLVVVGRQQADSLLRWLPGKLFQHKKPTD